MLVRAYRLTDKFGLVILKTTSAATGAVLNNAAVVRRLVIGGLIGTVLAVIWSILRRVGLLLLAVLRALGAIGLRLLFFFQRMFGTASQYAGESTNTAMARRAARAELDAGLVEDPLKSQNRVLSGVIVALLAALIGVVLWATNPAAQTPTLNAPVQFNNNVNLQSTPDDDTTPNAAVGLPTPVPTATPIPSILEARGSLAYTVREKAQDDIWVVSVGERTPMRLIASSVDDRDPAWSPDGRQLAYASRQDGNWEIYIYDLQSGNSSRMTFDLSYQGTPNWSPDNQWLVYESYQGDNLDVYLMRVDGSQVERLTAHPEPDFAPVWSPDGRRIAFVSWRDGNQDIYVISLDDPRDEAAVNITNSPTRNEDHPTWSPDGSLLAYSALDEGVEKVFVKLASDPEAQAQVLGRGSSPTWSPDGSSLIVSVDSFDGTQLVAIPFAQQGVATLVIPVGQRAISPNWTASPLPAALVNSGGVNSAIPEALFVEQEERAETDPPYKLQSLVNIDTQIAALSDRVNDSFSGLREHVNDDVGVDFLGELEDAFWGLDRLPQPGEERRNWHMTGRGFAINRNNIAGFPPPIEVVREDEDINTYWRVYIRVAENAQDGQLGEPLRQMPWDFISRNQGDVDAYNQGGRLRQSVPSGYYVDLTQLAADYGWQRLPAGTDWRANFNSTNYWMFYKPDGLNWYEAMRELYSEGELGGFAPRATTIPAQQEGSPEPQATPTVAAPPPTSPPQETIQPLLPPPPTIETGEGS